VLDARFIVLSHKLPQGYPSNESKSLFFSAMLNAFTQQLQSYNPIRSISTTIAGSAANKTEFTFMSNGQQAEGIVLFSIIGDKFYLLSYGAAKYSYPVLLPSAQAMINSFLPIKETISAAHLSINSNPASNTTASATNATTPAASFHSSFDTFVVPGSVNGYGVYQTHNSSIFKPGEKILLYIEPAGYSYKPVGSLFLMNFTADVLISNRAGHVLTGLQNLPISTLISHHKNKELLLTVSLTQTSPFPIGEYVLKYTIHDTTSGNSFDIARNITIANG